MELDNYPINVTSCAPQ